MNLIFEIAMSDTLTTPAGNAPTFSIEELNNPGITLQAVVDYFASKGDTISPAAAQQLIDYAKSIAQPAAQQSVVTGTTATNSLQLAPPQQFTNTPLPASVGSTTADPIIPPGGIPTALPGNAASTGLSNAAQQLGTQGSIIGVPNNVAGAAVSGNFQGYITTANANGVPLVPQAPQNLNDAAGRRVRLRPKPNASSQIYGASGLMTPLSSTNGMLFPYQPAITWSQDVTYTQMEIVHANQDFYSYSKTPALKLTVEGDFTVQNQKEGLYSLACIHFLRTVTKMYFGGTGGVGDLSGTPPPVLLFDAYGQFMFNALPVIVTQFSVTLPKDVDYVPVQTAYSVNTEYETGQQSFSFTQNSASAYDPGLAATAFNNLIKPTPAATYSQGFAWLPAVFTISVQLTVQNTPQRLRAFNLDQFRTGQLLINGTWI